MADQTELEQHAGAVVVRVTGSVLDETNLPSVRAAVGEAGERFRDEAIALDLAAVGFMPSVSLGGLIQLAQFFRARKQRFALVNVQPTVREMLVLTRLDRIFEVHGSLSEFLKAVGKT
ncbi:MAG: STAS domain-containing protein [Phycisphaeraceae bacterium]|nr:STAS domain-containing protein [Phycisphaeraceae bacterium]